MTPTALAGTETKMITEALSKILPEETKSPVAMAEIAEKISSAVEPVGKEQQKIYKKAVDFVNEHREKTTQILDPGLKNAEQNKSQIIETLTNSAKQIEQNAPDVKQRFLKTAPTSASSHK